MSEHTPGPWRVEPVVGTWIQTDGDPYGHGQMHIADVRGWGHLTGQGACALKQDAAVVIQTANADLIAAAPDLKASYLELREALAGAMRVLHDNDTDELDLCGKFVSEMARIGIKDEIGLRADYALAKAEGR